MLEVFDANSVRKLFSMTSNYHHYHIWKCSDHHSKLAFMEASG